MYYYEVLVAANYHRSEALTYSGPAGLMKGRLVNIPLRNREVIGVVINKSSKPSFQVKPIARVYNELPVLPSTTLQLVNWLQGYYPAPLGITMQQFLPRLLSKDIPKTKVTEPEFTPQNIGVLSLTNEQKRVIENMKVEGSYLLHGVTGSGKTQVYIELARQVIAANQSVLVLTPEIGLTPQLIQTFKSNFQNQVIVLHSDLTPKERRLNWLTILQATTPLIVVGTRSALFSPLRNIGLVVIDEAHENAYKQEQAPYYQALRVASALSGFAHARLVIGSATPTVNDYYFAQAKHIPILTMKHTARPIAAIDKAEIEVVDLKDRSRFTYSTHLSDKLVDYLREALNNHEQSLLFLNRRGTAKVIICQQCGWQALCPRCDIPLTYHADNHQLECHTCTYKTRLPINCPICQSPDILFKSPGTKALVDEVQRLFPNASIKRFDTDNKKAESFAQQYKTVKDGSVDIIIGTQTLAKGLDLPKLSVVGVVNADISLYLPDYTASERTYQLITQVIGRIGRGHIKGRAVIQTYQPENPTLKAAIDKDWDAFYKHELHERQSFLYPPFCFLLKLTCSRSRTLSAEKAAQQLIYTLREHQLKIQINGPLPAFHAKDNGQYAWQVILKAKDRQELVKVIRLLPSGWTYNIDPINLL